MRKAQSERITWDSDETAEAIGITTRHLRSLIAKGQGPKPIRLGRRVFFDPETVKTWLKSKQAA